MLLEILKRTPSWVFLLFAVLVLFGAMQSRARQISFARVAILPLVLTGLSLSGLWATFRGGYADVAIVAWIAAVVVAVLLNELAQCPAKPAELPS